MKKFRETIQENRNWSTVLKMVLIGILLLIFLIPLQMIRALIEERNMTRLEAEGEIIQMWGGEQIIAGPVVVVPYLKRVKDEEGKIEEFTERAYFLPNTLEIAGSVDTEKRNRGIRSRILLERLSVELPEVRVRVLQILMVLPSICTSRADVHLALYLWGRKPGCGVTPPGRVPASMAPFCLPNELWMKKGSTPIGTSCP